MSRLTMLLLLACPKRHLLKVLQSLVYFFPLAFIYGNLVINVFVCLIVLFGIYFYKTSLFSWYKKNNLLILALFFLTILLSSYYQNFFVENSKDSIKSILYLRYFIFIREILKDTNSEIPEYLNEIIFYLGHSFEFYFNENESRYLFNGSHNLNITEFKRYLKEHGYKFKNKLNSIGGYLILKNKKDKIIIDFGSTPEKKYSNEYQSGVLSFEIFHDNEKLITNCGYFQNYNHKLNILSKSTAAHSTLSIDDRSSCKFKKGELGNFSLDSNLKVINKKFFIEYK